MKFFGRAFIAGAIEDDTLVTIADGVIASIDQIATPPADAQRVRGIIAPGFIDIHVHGGDGADFMDASVEANARILGFHARHGTTTLMATTLSASRHDLQSAVEAIAATSYDEGAAIAGIHLEGPF